MVTRKTPAVRIALAAASLALALVPVALAGNGHGGGGKPNGGGTCTPAAPGIVVQNTYAWGQWGSWGYPGQRLGYFIQVINYDAGHQYNLGREATRNSLEWFQRARNWAQLQHEALLSAARRTQRATIGLVASPTARTTSSRRRSR